MFSKDERSTGTVTFLFTDIEGSTKLAQEFPETVQTALNKHHTILQNIIESNNGFVFEIVGDAFCAAFVKASDAVKTAVEIQTSLAKEQWNDAEIKVRIGIHSGNVEWNGERFTGYMTLARTARVMSTAYGQQILITNDTYKLVADLYQSGKNILFADLGERRLKDLNQPMRLFQLKGAGLREDFPALKTLDTRRNNLPVQLSSFIGRDKEIDEIKDLLKQTHLLTLTGSGGAGKTRLALQAASELIDEFESGVWFIELDSLTDESHLATSIIKILGIIENSKHTAEELLIDYLKDKQMLLIFDNCEHVIEAASSLAYKILTKCPDLIIIATSREALRCDGEIIYQVATLDYPDARIKHSLEDISGYESVKLFIERAAAVNSNFRLTEENKDMLALICCRLEGIPLAIELAAARTKTLSLSQINQRLDDRFSLLTTGSRTSQPRQQTLRNLIEWSHELLTEKEKILWSRLSVFSGGWTLEAAENICSCSMILKKDIVRLLEALTEKSIIQFNDEKVRYSMLETLKQFGLEKLRESMDNEYDKLIERHLKFYTDLALTCDEQIRGKNIVSILNILDVESRNIETAIKRALKGQQSDAARIAVAMRYYWDIRGFTSEALERMELILNELTDDELIMKHKVMTAMGSFYRLKSNFAKAKELFDECLEYYRKSNNREGIAESLNNLGLVEFNRGEYPQAFALANESLEIREKTGDKNLIADTLSTIGHVLFYQGNYDPALEIFKRSIAIRREIEDLAGIAISLNGIGLIALDQGDYRRAIESFDENLSINRQIGFKHGIAITLNNLGAIEQEQGDYKKASDYHEESLAIRRQIGDKRGIALILCNLGSVNYEWGNYDRACEYYRESLKIAQEVGDKYIINLAKTNLGIILQELGAHSEAKEFLESVLKTVGETGDKVAKANSLQGLGHIALDLGEYDTATEHYKKSLEIRNETGSKRGSTISYEGLGNVAFANGNYTEALENFTNSLKISREIGDKYSAATAITSTAKVKFEQKDYAGALKLIDDASLISRDIGNKKLTAQILYYKGLIYIRTGNASEARELIIESLNLRNELGIRLECALCILALTEFMMTSGNYSLALKYVSFVKNYAGLNGHVINSYEKNYIEESLTLLKEKLNEEDFEKYGEEGRAMAKILTAAGGRISPEMFIELKVKD